VKNLRPNESLKCDDFPCSDIKKDRYEIPGIEVKVENVNTIMISEAPPENEDDYFYSQGNPFYMKTTIQAFNDAGFDAKNITDVIRLGVYITTAIKCPKTSYSVSQETIENCSSRILEREIALFPKAKAILLMGETAIKAMNLITKRTTGKMMIPVGPTYRVRKSKYFYNEVRVLPSYLQTGKSYLIEKSKRTMIAEDIREALGHQG
jgi:uracil-DNA glycosylase